MKSPPSGSALAGAPAFRNPIFGGRIAELDGLRGIAIALVVVWHYVPVYLPVFPGGVIGALLLPLRIAWSGVDLFFVLSGFLIGGILLDAKGSPRFFPAFYARRFYRILPLYFVVLGTFYLGVAVVGPSAAPYLRDTWNFDLPAWCYPIFAQNFFMSARQTFGGAWLMPTWSLAVEEQFYALLPFAVWSLSRRRLAWCVGVAVVSAPLLRTALMRSNPYFGPYTLFPCRADALGLGVLAALAVRDEAAWTWLREHPRHRYAALAVLGCGVAFLFQHSQGRIMNTIGYSWMAAFYATVLLSAVVAPGRVTKAILGSAPLQELGTLAYGVYLFHIGANFALHALFFHSAPTLDSAARAGATVAAGALTYALAKLSWRVFERPLVRRAQIAHPY